MKVFSISRILAPAAAILLAVPLAACHALTPGPDIKSRTEVVLDAQYAVKDEQKPMQAAEADKIHDGYIESLGKGQAKEQKRIQGGDQ